MLKTIKISALVISLLLSTNIVHADITLAAARIGAKDVPALAGFYKAAFGLQEVMKLDNPGLQEIMLNFGDTVDSARANSNAQIVIMNRASDDVEDTVPHLIFYISDMAATVESIKAAGGSMNGDPMPFGNTGMVIGFGTDPAGNQFELIQRPAQ